jgi:membrane associated rhomboid family serine protease
MPSFYAAYTPWKLGTIYTSMFLHAGIPHILMNMFFLALLGVPFEDKIGAKSFLAIYLLSGLAAALLAAICAIYFPTAFGLNPYKIGVGASGAIFGILGAFAMLYPREEVVFPLLLIRPWPVWLIAIVYFALESAVAIAAPQDHVGHFAHLGGLIGGVGLACCLSYIAKRRGWEGLEGKKVAEVDYRALAALATTPELNVLYQKIEKEEIAEVRDAWLERYIQEARCPRCRRAKLMLQRSSVSCRACAYSLKIR